MAARIHLTHPEIVRQRIRTSQLVLRLTNHAHGRVEMSATQVTAALGLLRKSLPDLTAISHSGVIETIRPEELSNERLASIAAGSGARTVEPEIRVIPHGEVH